LRLKDKIKNVFLGLYILQLFNYIAPLVIIPILIKYIGLGEYGELVYITSIYQIVALIIDFGFTYTGPVVAARHRCETQNLQRYYSIVVLLKSLLFIIALTCVFLLCRLNIVHLSFFGFLSIFLCTIGNILSPNWFLQGIGDFKKLSYSQVIVRITLFIILLVYVCSGGDNVFILSFLQNATLLICCIYLWPNIHISHVVHLKPNECIVEFKKAGNVFIGVIGTIGYNGLIPVLIGNLCGNTSLGVFSIVQKMTTACQSLI
ncbi:TPA: O6 family O-antigen flippase, partial [Escherichia coli]